MNTTETLKNIETKKGKLKKMKSNILKNYNQNKITTMLIITKNNKNNNNIILMNNNNKLLNNLRQVKLNNTKIKIKLNNLNKTNLIILN